MSLNGLDAPEVTEAYQTAIAEPGGWFLLKYTARDSVDLLAKGKHGVSEARSAVVAYSEHSPLYGLLMYRRRRILMKYIPEGTSRLLQARTAVHLQDVLERYSPYETLLELTNSDGLNDTALAASFQLHTASPSPSMARLDELREEDEGESGQASTPEAAAVSERSASLPGAQRHRADRAMGRRGARSMTSFHAPGALAKRTTPPTSPPLSPDLTVPATIDANFLPLTPRESPMPTQDATFETTEVRAATEAHTDDYQAAVVGSRAEYTQADGTEGRGGDERESDLTSSSAEGQPREHPPRRDSLAVRGSGQRAQSMDEEPFDFSQYDALFKPKVKLAPRPINAAEKALRPTAPRVSAMPAVLKAAPKKQEASRPKTSGQDIMARSATAPCALESGMPALPSIPDIPAHTPRPMSRGSVRSAPLHKSGPMSADKIRLMKAVELRKKQLRKSQSSTPIPVDEHVPEVPSLPAHLTNSEPKQEPVAVSMEHQEVKQGHSRSKSSQETEPELQSTDDESQNHSTKADSGIELRYGTPDTQRTEETIDEVQEPAEKDDDGEVKNVPTDASEPGSSGIAVEAQADDESSTRASQTPTERPTVSEQGSGSTTRNSQLSLNPDGQPATASIGSTVSTESAVDEDPSPQIGAADERPSVAALPVPQDTDGVLVKRRRGYVQPLVIDAVNGDLDEAELDSDDDALFEELHTATVQEARPIKVARSPMAMTFQPRTVSSDGSLGSARPLQISRTLSMPRELIHTPPMSASDSRSVSPILTPEKPEVVAARSRNVSSGISKRIQALAELSSRESSGSASSATFLPENTLGGPIKVSRRNLPAIRPLSRKQNSRTSIMPNAATSTEEKLLTGSVQHDPVTKRESISVTTRISRPGTTSASGTPTNEYSAMEQDSADPSPLTAERDPPLSSAASLASVETRSVRSTRSRNGRLWKERKMSQPTIEERRPQSQSERVTSSISLPTSVENAASEKPSKASRFFKRMSTLASSKKKNTSAEAKSPVKTESMPLTPEEEEDPTVEVVTKPDTPPAALVGDLNVQFPDSLLWKRRLVTIDDSGYLQFAIAQAMDIHRGVAMKRFALTDFRAPYTPDLDQQELPHSVVLEFDDGTALQVACEDGMTQRQVLSLLTTYWKAYSWDGAVEA